MIEIKKGLYGSSYFGIGPIKIKDIKQDTNDLFNIQWIENLCISIEEMHVQALLYPIILKYFDENLYENKKRYTFYNKVSFEEYNTYNYYTIDSIKKIIQDTEEIIQLFEQNSNDERCREILYGNYCGYIKDEAIIFYKKFNSYLQTMIINSEKFNYHLIAFEGP
ncbi:MAG: hypothetical protein J6W29_06690 [Neisseriaceae bacterium]|nr:hypothetical protein [Neisseriaceae bacterium]